MSSSISRTQQNAIGALFMTMAAVMPASATGQPSLEIDLTRKFNMQVQLTPYTRPQNPEFRVVEIDCSKLGKTPEGNNFIITKGFAEPFDLPPYYKGSSGGSPAAEGTAMLTHLGSRMNDQHQLCVAHNEMFTGAARRQPQEVKARGHKVTVNGADFYTSVNIQDDRYCPPIAAAKICTNTPAVRSSISPVFQFNDQTNTLEIVPGNL
jgi:hypothetical protein